jgi:hypothetical protein
MQFERDEPSVESKDRKERIRARRARIREKMEIKGSDSQGGVGVLKRKETEKTQVLKGKAQIHDSKRSLRKLLEEGDEDVTRVMFRPFDMSGKLLIYFANRFEWKGMIEKIRGEWVKKLVDLNDEKKICLKQKAVQGEMQRYQ